LTGGEPLAQADFAAAILSLCKALSIHTAIETSGQAPWDAFAKILPYVDIVLFDIKESDPARLYSFTGGDFNLILENLSRLDAQGVEIVLRCPIIPGINDRDDHFAAIGALADRLKSVSRIEVEPYNPLGQSKSGRVGKPLLYVNDTIPDEASIALWSANIKKHTRCPVKLY
jgi:pyruvate formate lyase activating enzyme